MNTNNNISCCWTGKTTEPYNPCTVLLLIISPQILRIVTYWFLLTRFYAVYSDSGGFPNSPGNHLSVIHTYVHTYPTYFVFRSHQQCAHSSTKQVTICPKIPHIFVIYAYPEVHLVYYSEHIHLFRKTVTTIRILATYQLRSKLSLLEKHQGYCMSAP